MPRSSFCRKRNNRIYTSSGNTTGSHIAGAKDDPYGKLENLMQQQDVFAKL